MKKIFTILLFLLFIPLVSAKELPKLYLYGDLDFMSSKTDKREIEIELVDEEYGFKEKGTIKLQGKSSLNYDKKNYNISFENKVKTSLGEFKKYTLKANWIDPLHFRNLLTADIISSINKDYKLFEGTVNNGLTKGFFIEVYNNEEYMGLYSMNIHKDYLFDIGDKKPLVIGVKNDVEQVYFHTHENDKWEGFEVEEGEQDQESLDKLNDLIDFINNSNDYVFKRDFAKHINLDSALNYYCIMHVLSLTDNVVNNLYLVNYEGDYWYLDFYDLDISWGGDNIPNKLLSYDRNLNKEVKGSRLWYRFEKAFAKEIQKRYVELRKDSLSKEHLLEKYYEYADMIPEDALARENEKWNNKVSYDKNFVDEYLEKRLVVIDRKISDLGRHNFILFIPLLIVVYLVLLKFIKKKR